MNPLNYASLEASKRLVAAGIVLETEAWWKIDQGGEAMSIYDCGARFEVICKRCGLRFWVIRNWGGGVRRADNENCNPAKCTCGSLKLEVF